MLSTLEQLATLDLLPNKPDAVNIMTYGGICPGSLVVSSIVQPALVILSISFCKEDKEAGVPNQAQCLSYIATTDCFKMLSNKKLLFFAVSMASVFSKGFLP